MSIVEKAVDKLRDKAVSVDKQRESRSAVGGRRRVERATSGPRDTDATERASGLKLNLSRLRAAGVLPPESMEVRVRDEYRRIKRPLLANINGKGAAAVDAAHRIMVTSAVAGEGKTFTSFNLAFSLAQERDVAVLLVDGDVARPVSSRVTGLEDKPGLLDLLSDESLDPESMVLPTDWENLSILPAGTPRALMTELLSSARMDELVSILERVPGGRRILLFDSPPLLATSEAVALSSAMGQVLVVVKAGHTLHQQVKGALDLLDPAKAINLVLNQSLRSHGADQYGGYYGYGYQE